MNPGVVTTSHEGTKIRRFGTVKVFKEVTE